ncbi:MAG: HAD hydrolase-like protein [Bacillota bacterium]|jgi:FMN phosphatase YigB (HAD superfamily)
MGQYQALLFDLDGTLLEIDATGFYHAYLGMIAVSFPQVRPDRFVNQLVISTREMLANNGSKTNREVFAASFYPSLGLDPGECEPVLERFYSREFPRLERYGRPKAGARRVLEYVVSQGMGIVVATNPVFPRAAVMERLRWARLEDIPFDLVTTYEIMHFCKPSLGYYREILDITGYEAPRCVMVGNDVSEDMNAQEVGMDAFLVTDQVIPRGDGVQWNGPQGSLDEFLAKLTDGRKGR